MRTDGVRGEYVGQYNHVQSFVKHLLLGFLTMWVCERVRVMVFNATFNNISVISWRSVLLVEESGGPGENKRPPASQ